MDLRRIAMVGLSLVLAGVGPACGTIIRKQQNNSEPYADGLKTGTRNKKPEKPLRAIVHTAAHDASAGFVDGALDALDQEKRRKQFEKLAKDLNTAAGSATSAAVGGVTDGLQKERAALRKELSGLFQDVKDDLHLDPEAAAKRVMKAAFSEAGAGMRDHLRPQVKGMTNDVVGSVRTGLEGLVGPGLKQKVHDNVVPALDEILGRVPKTGADTATAFTGALADSLNHGVDGSLGMRIDSLVVRLGERIDGLVDRSATRIEASLDKQTDKADRWVSLGLLSALLIAIMALVIAIIRWLSERHARLVAKQAQLEAAEQTRKTEEMLTLVASAIQRAGADGSVEDFRDQIKALSQVDGWLNIRAKLDEFLIRNKLKLERPRA